MSARITLSATCDGCGRDVVVDAPGLIAELPAPWFVVVDRWGMFPTADGAAFCGPGCARSYIERVGDRGTTYTVAPDGRPPIVVNGRGRPTRVRPTYFPAHGH